jgi:hypothetical protein
MSDEFTPEEQQRLAELHAAGIGKMRTEPPPPDEAENWLPGIQDIDHADGTTTWGIRVWFPKAEAEAWERLRFRHLRSESPEQADPSGTASPKRLGGRATGYESVGRRPQKPF